MLTWWFGILSLVATAGAYGTLAYAARSDIQGFGLVWMFLECLFLPLLALLLAGLSIWRGKEHAGPWVIPLIFSIPFALYFMFMVPMLLLAGFAD